MKSFLLESHYCHFVYYCLLVVINLIIKVHTKTQSFCTVQIDSLLFFEFNKVCVYTTPCILSNYITIYSYRGHDYKKV